jgi:hypothetical protein
MRARIQGRIEFLPAHRSGDGSDKSTLTEIRLG